MAIHKNTAAAASFVTAGQNNFSPRPAPLRCFRILLCHSLIKHRLTAQLRYPMAIPLWRKYVNTSLINGQDTNTAAKKAYPVTGIFSPNTE